MSTPLLATKLYLPLPPSDIVARPRLIEKMNIGLARKLTLISASAGFGKTTLVSEWIAACERPAAWLSLDKRDSDPTRFLTYLVAALQTLAPNIGEGALGMLQSPQPPSTESILTTLLNEIATVSDNFTLVLDDYHVIDAKAVDDALAFLLEHLPKQMHLVIITREDPPLPLARYRVRGELTELRTTDLRFTPPEAAAFLEGMGLNLSEEDIIALETRTEGWIAGLQLAAISMQGQDTSSFIQSFTGSHRFVLDYLVEEVLQQQPESIQTFLLHTSILNRLCGPLCDAVLLDSSVSGQETLEYLEHANLFIVPLDNERNWYRYHHLFAELLRQRLHRSLASSAGDEGRSVTELHIRASVWYEDNGLEIESFHHAAAANDVERAERLIYKKGLHLHSLGVAAILGWLASLPATVLDARPSLWVRYASALLIGGQTTDVEEKLQAAEAALATALQGAEPDDKTRDLIGQIATARATMALSQYQIKTIIAQSHRALEYLHPDNLSSRYRVNWTVAYAYHFRGERAAARRAYTDALSLAQMSGNILGTALATLCLGQIQELENQLHPAAETYRRSLQLLGDHPPPSTCEAYLGLARISYEWNDLDAAEQHGQQSLQLARQYDRSIDRFVIGEVFLARLKLAQGDVTGAAVMLAKTEQSVLQDNFVHRIPEVAAAQVLVLLRQGKLESAGQLAQTHELPFSQAQVYLAQGDTASALVVLERLRQQMDEKGWQDERLKVMVLQAVALHAYGEKDKAVQLLSEALALAEPGGFIRIFVDEGLPMAQLLSEAIARGIMPNYASKLLAAFEISEPPPPQELVDPLSKREIEILALIATGFKNKEIAEQLVISLNTVLYHTKNIYRKLDVNKRTLAIAKAKEINLI